MPEGPLNVGGLSGAFAGDGALIGQGGTGNGDTAYTFGNLNGVGVAPQRASATTTPPA